MLFSPSSPLSLLSFHLPLRTSLELSCYHFLINILISFRLFVGELQRFAIGIVAVQKGQMYMFDEPSSYLDVKQRLKAALVIRDLVLEATNPDYLSTYVICVEHDLSVLDYLSDYICCLYGTPGVYGVVTMPFSVREVSRPLIDTLKPVKPFIFDVLFRASMFSSLVLYPQRICDFVSLNFRSKFHKLV